MLLLLLLLLLPAGELVKDGAGALTAVASDASGTSSSDELMLLY